MESLILPMVLMLGDTINLLNYEKGSNLRYSPGPIFQSSRDWPWDKNYVDTLNSTYYILQDEKMPYSDLRLPIDLVRRAKSGNFDLYSAGISFLGSNLRGSMADRVVFLFVAEAIKLEIAIKEHAVPREDWQDFVPLTHTHYADKNYRGGRCIYTAEVTSTVPGDTQIVRRILTDVMGSSGTVVPDTVDVWKQALRALNASSDVRGSISANKFAGGCQNMDLLIDPWRGTVEDMFRTMPRAQRKLNPYAEEYPPLLTRLKPLRNLDDAYPAVKKNEVSEDYLVLLDEMVDDLDLTSKKLEQYFHGFSSGKFQRNMTVETSHIFRNFSEKVESLREKMRNLPYGEMSIYKDLDEELFEDVFKSYKAGLDKGNRNYYTAYKKLIEDLATVCGMHFVEPTSGILATREDEVLSKVFAKGGLEECKLRCRTNTRCRAIGYLSIFPYRCLIYSRSTKTATIEYPEYFRKGEYDRFIYSRSTSTSNSVYPASFMKVFDRICKTQE